MELLWNYTPGILHAGTPLNSDLSLRARGPKQTLLLLLLTSFHDLKDVTKSYLKPVAEWRERLIGRCFPVVTFICRMTVEEIHKKTKKQEQTFIFIKD